MKPRVTVLALFHRLGKTPSLDTKWNLGTVDDAHAAAAAIAANAGVLAQLANIFARQCRRGGNQPLGPIGGIRSDPSNAENFFDDGTRHNVLGGRSEQLMESTRTVPSGQRRATVIGAVSG